MKRLLCTILFAHAGSWRDFLQPPRPDHKLFQANLKKIQDKFDAYNPNSFPERVIQKYNNLETQERNRNASNPILGQGNKWNFCTLIAENPDFFQGNTNHVHIKDKLALFLGWHVLPNYCKYYKILQSGLLQGFEENPTRALKFIRANPDLLYRLNVECHPIRSIILDFLGNKSDMLCVLYRKNGWNVYIGYFSNINEQPASLTFTQAFSWHDFLKDCLEHFFGITRDVMDNMERNVFLSCKTKGSFFCPGRLTDEGKQRALSILNSIYKSIDELMFQHPIFDHNPSKSNLTVHFDDDVLTFQEFEKADKLVDVVLKGFKSIPVDPNPVYSAIQRIKAALDKLIGNPKSTLASLANHQRKEEIKNLIAVYSRPVN